ncbi:hypothetical protein EDF57_10669 [Novosphingobium sp. PhB55]|uniref:hypothetical protein n=1 Tax=Novosphingobium sp. PhB55 TaxID=2485106 RepID=UPI00106642BB|nr:hypothetical protein [Novosphingobium sp. PhB55]TDW63114.1 hypothetical protein EDF57_10669 [Novosphingobium sp. PhB55]
MTSDIDALSSLAAIALNVPQDDEPQSDIDEVRKLAVRSLTDATAHRCVAEKANALYDAAMEKHHELLALADRMEAMRPLVTLTDELAAELASVLEQSRALSSQGVIRRVT